MQRRIFVAHIFTCGLWSHNCIKITWSCLWEYLEQCGLRPGSLLHGNSSCSLFSCWGKRKPSISQPIEANHNQNAFVCKSFFARHSRHCAHTTVIVHHRETEAGIILMVIWWRRQLTTSVTSKYSCKCQVFSHLTVAQSLATNLPRARIHKSFCTSQVFSAHSL